MADQLLGWLWFMAKALGLLVTILRCILSMLRVIPKLRQAWKAAFRRSSPRLRGQVACGKKPKKGLVPQRHRNPT